MATSLVKNLPFSPSVTGALLYALTRAPDQYRKPLLQRLSQYLSPKNIARAIATLKWLVALGLARNAHVFLSDIAQNNFRLRSERHRYVWETEIAVVTGAASGFGALMSKGLAEKSIKVIAVDIRDELPLDLQAINNIHYYKCDITNRQSVMDLAEWIHQEHGEVSILINNAGVCYEHSILDASEKALNNLYGVNIISHYYTLQAFLPNMIKNKKGHVVATASMASFLSPPGLIPYCNTKAAVLSLHDGLLAEMRVMYKCPEVKFSIVHPTFADTPMVQPFKNELNAAKAFVLDPQVVSDAVVKQILSGKGRQIIVGGGTGWLAGIRAWPHWISQAILRSGDNKIKLADVGTERTGG
ncbi:hypothetical protein LTR37_013562 [Vermiconidia calcicola]|uniref:Uncharacterized protein n=1 Tax=Vermiconidia calcicola TaxID=1690605 RepID=A0ACC3MYW2_9PEZI|nr:hypothetical protein LTR37_013562 [Vermiconidia calcicola]